MDETYATAFIDEPLPCIDGGTHITPGDVGDVNDDNIEPPIKRSRVELHTHEVIETELIALQNNEKIISDAMENDYTDQIDIDETLPTQTEEEIQSAEFQPPSYTFEPNHYKQIAHRNWPRKTPAQNYLRGCKWSPDGTCVLSAIQNDGMKLFELPNTFYTNDSVNDSLASVKLNAVVNVPESGLIYDFCWFPLMHSGNSATCCWASTAQHGPVQLWDAFDGHLRCTYRGYNAVDEVEAALSVNFTHDGTQLLCGYTKSLKIFDVNVPGRKYVNHELKKSVISIGTSPMRPDIYALGSWDKKIELISTDCDPVATLIAHEGAVNLLKFSPDGTQLFSGARRDNQIHCWDLRSFRRPCRTFTRDSNTNQRIYFDLSTCGNWLVSGGVSGALHVFHLGDGVDNFEVKLPLQSDCINSVSLHPYRPIIVTGSGQHHFFGHDDDSDVSSDEGIQADLAVENDMKIWWLGNIERTMSKGE